MSSWWRDDEPDRNSKPADPDQFWSGVLIVVCVMIFVLVVMGLRF